MYKSLHLTELISFFYMCKSVFYVTRQTQSATITDKSSFSVKQTRQKYHCVKIKSFLFYWMIDTTCWWLLLQQRRRRCQFVVYDYEEEENSKRQLSHIWHTQFNFQRLFWEIDPFLRFNLFSYIYIYVCSPSTVCGITKKTSAVDIFVYTDS